MVIERLEVDLAARARAAAQRAASAAGVSVRELDDHEEFKAAQRLLKDVWELSEPLVQGTQMRALLHAGNFVSGAFRDADLVGISLGFLGWREGDLHLHSHVTGVVKGLQGRSVGFALKQYQRAWALEHDLDEVAWTFDPLVGRNGYFNITKLGAEIVEYKTNFYGDLREGINGMDDTDRCVVSWRVASDRAVRAAEGSPDVIAAAPGGTTKVLSEDGDGSPKITLHDGALLAARVPRDIVAMRAQAPATATRWRHALREVLVWAFGEGFVVTGMTREGDYLLSRSR